MKKKYDLNINEIKVVNKLLSEGKLIDDGENLFIPLEYIYVSNSILLEFIGGSYE